MKPGSVVLIAAYGRNLPALVLAARSGEVSHLGSDGEPILTVAFLDPAREPGLTKDKNGNFVYPVGRLPQVFIEHDVVHESHEFDAEYWKSKRISPEAVTPAITASHRGHAEYSEYIPEEAKDFVDELRKRIRSAESAADKAGDEAAKQRARADLAESKLKALEATKASETPAKS